MSTSVGDEGGFAPNLASNEDAIKVLVEAIERAGYVPGDDIAIALDPASSEVYRDGRYVLAGEGRELDFPTGSSLSGSTCATSTRSSLSRTAWPRTTGTAGLRSPAPSADRVQIVGDDLFRHQRRASQPGHP